MDNVPVLTNILGLISRQLFKAVEGVDAVKPVNPLEPVEAYCPIGR
jgi:hypothetical protein